MRQISLKLCHKPTGANTIIKTISPMLRGYLDDALEKWPEDELELTICVDAPGGSITSDGLTATLNRARIEADAKLIDEHVPAVKNPR